MSLDSFESRRMIVVVDGHDGMRAALCALLRAEGHLVAQASSGEKALAVLELFASVGLILLAWKPGQRSAEVLAKLRRRPALAQIPVIALGADKLERPTGVHGYVPKPIMPARVLQLARWYCGDPNGWDDGTSGASA
jgi:CheY-like chemotaxis protein